MVVRRLGCSVWVLMFVIRVVMVVRRCNLLLCRFFSHAMIRMLMRILKQISWPLL